MASHSPTTTYPTGTVTGLIGGDRMTAKTSEVLRARLAPVAAPAIAVLDDDQQAVLAALAARLLPQDGQPTPIDLAGTLHHRLAAGLGDGWRYAVLPPDPEMVGRGLNALDSTAGGFVALVGAAQDTVLHEVQSGRAAGPVWGGVDPARWFEEVLAMLVDIYYSHPLAQEDIGYLGMADARGWQATGFGARRGFEPEPA